MTRRPLSSVDRSRGARLDRGGGTRKSYPGTVTRRETGGVGVPPVLDVPVPAVALVAIGDDGVVDQTLDQSLTGGVGVITPLESDRLDLGEEGLAVPHRRASVRASLDPEGMVVLGSGDVALDRSPDSVLPFGMVHEISADTPSSQACCLSARPLTVSHMSEFRRRVVRSRWSLGVQD